MKYVTEYEVCAFVFLFVVTARFLSMHKFPSKLNGLFSIILCCSLVDILLDIISAYTIHYATDIPLWINYADNTLFLMFQVLIPVLMLRYAFAMSGINRPRFRILMVTPSLCSTPLLVINFFYGIIFYFEPSDSGYVYCHGALFNVLYATALFYMILTVGVVIVNRHSLRKIEIGATVLFNIIIVISIIMQSIFPNTLLTGVAISLAILIMFCVMQNPETMLDNITGVFNHSALDEYLRTMVLEKRNMFITAVDVGGIRRVNGLLGLRAGNEILEKVGTFLNGICGNDAQVFRMVSTRFLFITGNADTHKKIVESVTERFMEPWVYNENSLSLIATVRYCKEVHSFSSSDDVVNLIDFAFSKTSGNDFGTTKPIGSELLSQSRRITLVDEAIRCALNTNTGFSINFQPLYSTGDKAFSNAEVLLRLNDSILGNISPAEFIPVAESSGLIRKIDSLVLDMTSKFLAAHPELENAGLKMLEVNLSATEFYNETDTLKQDFFNKLTSYENKICLEVTETAATRHCEILKEFMTSMIERGVSFAIDDFGTGYANITQLSNLPFSIVKLDKTFLSAQNYKDKIILGDLIKMFDRTGIKTVVEGVETAEQARMVNDFGASHIQGYYYSKPLSEEKFVDFMMANKTA